MTDVSMAVEQDAIADSLMGEPAEQSPVEQTGTEQQEFVEQESQADAQGELEQQQEQTDDWLPSEQEKVFPDEVLLRYAQRYGLNELPANQQQRQLLVDKINADVMVRQYQQQLEQLQQPEYEEVEQQPEPTRQMPQLTPDQHFANIQRYAQERTSPEAAKWFHNGFMKSLGVPDAQIAQMPPEQAQRFGEVVTAGVANVVNTIIGDVLQNQLLPLLEHQLPGLGELHERFSYASAWDRVRNSNPQYSGLPAFGTKEFTSTLHKAANQFPELIAAFEGPDGRIPASKAGQAYSLLAKIATGQTVDPKLLQQTAAAQVRNSRRADVKRAAGNLGSGQAKAASQRPNSQFQTNQDIFDDDTMDLYQREHGRL